MRTLVATVLAAAVLTGCATDLYSYRAGPGDYYYGRPQTDVRVWGGYSYGYPYYYGPYGYPYRYGPYRYYGPYDPYWYGWYGYPHYHDYRPRHPHPRPGHDDDDHRDRSPWRNLDELRRRRSGDPAPPRLTPPPAPAPSAQPRIAPEERGSRLQQTIRRLERDRRPTPEP